MSVATQLPAGPDTVFAAFQAASARNTQRPFISVLRETAEAYDIAAGELSYGHVQATVERLSGADSGHPSLFMCREGWFWIIGLNETKSSVGFVTRPDFVKQMDVPPDQLLRWAIARCPTSRKS